MIFTERDREAQPLENLTEDQLYTLLGVRLKQVGDGGHARDRLAQEGTTPETHTRSDPMLAFGRDFFGRIERQAFDLMCGRGSTSPARRDAIANAFRKGESEVAAALSALLVSQLAVAPAIAPVVAALVIKLVYKPALGATCDSWTRRLSPKPDTITT